MITTASIINIVTIFLVLGLITLLGHLLSKGPTNSKTFFTAGGSLPWWAVSASLYATVLSAISFISIPAVVFKNGGNLTFLQIIIGFALSKAVLAILFVRPYYESKSIGTVYDYLAIRIHQHVATGAMCLAIFSSLLGTAVVVLSAALVLNVIADLSIAISCIIIVAFSILWSCMGGLKTVIWTDAMLFLVFVTGALFSAWFALNSSGLPLSEAITLLDNNAKLKIIDLSLDPSKSFTIYTGIICGTLMGMTIITTQSGMQRIRACRTVIDAQKAFVYSSFLYVTTLVLLAAGLGLSLFYSVNDLPEAAALQLTLKPDQVMPYFIINELPKGLSGVFIAAIFAAAISTLDSKLAELSDVSVTNIYKTYIKKEAEDDHYLIAARLFLIFWGIIVCAIAILLSQIEGQTVLNINYLLLNTLIGPVLGVFVLARFGIGNIQSIVIGLIASVIVLFYLRDQGVTHYWWLTSTFLIMVTIGLLGSRKRPELSGVI